MEPPVKKARKTHVSSPAKATCFPAPTGSPTMTDICKGYILQNTDKATTWALRVFNVWHQERNRVTTEKCPDDLLMLVILTVGSPVLLLSVDDKMESLIHHLLFPIFSLGCIGTARGVYVLVMLVAAQTL